MIDLILSDLDETFLLPDKTLSEVTERTLVKLDTLGIPFVPTTGRSVAHVPEALLAHSCVHYVIGSNGAAILDTHEGRLIYERTISKDAARELASLLRYEDVSFDVFDEHGAKTPAARYDRIASFGVDENSLRAMLSFRERVEATDFELIDEMVSIEKITIYVKDEAARTAVLQAGKTVSELALTSSHPKNIEFMRKHTSKGTALVHLAAKLEIPLSHVLAFGDSPNDALMLCAAGRGVAVENALPEVKAVADAICLSNAESGPAHYIQDALARGF